MAPNSASVACLLRDANPYITRPASLPSCMNAVPTPPLAPMQHLVGDQVIQDEDDGFRRVQHCRDVNELLRIQVDVLGVAPKRRERGDAVAGDEFGDPLADRIHLTQDAVARNEGGLGQKGPVADSDGNVVLAYRGRPETEPA